MIRTLLFAAIIPPATLLAAEKVTPATERYQKLVKEFEEEGGARTFAKRFLALAKEFPNDPAAVDALGWVIKKVRGRPDTDEALGLLAKHHLQSEKLEKVCAGVVSSRSAKAEPLLRGLLEKNPHQTVQEAAGYYLAKLLEQEAIVVSQLKSQPELERRVLQYYGKEYGKHLASMEADKLEQKRIVLYEQLGTSFPDEKIDGETIGEFAKKRLFGIRHLSVGKVAPEIEGEDVSGESFKLSDYRGKVVMLTFWGHW